MEQTSSDSDSLLAKVAGKVTDTITANTTDELEPIIDVLHDRWFDLEEVEWDRARESVTIRFAPERVRRHKVFRWRRRPICGPEVRWLLTISNAIDSRIVDVAGIGQFDFNELRYEVEMNRVVIDTDVPGEFEVKVSKLSIALSEAP